METGNLVLAEGVLDVIRGPESFMSLTVQDGYSASPCVITVLEKEGSTGIGWLSLPHFQDLS